MAIDYQGIYNILDYLAYFGVVAGVVATVIAYRFAKKFGGSVGIILKSFIGVVLLETFAALVLAVFPVGSSNYELARALSRVFRLLALLFAGIGAFLANKDFEKK